MFSNVLYIKTGCVLHSAIKLFDESMIHHCVSHSVVGILYDVTRSEYVKRKKQDNY